GAHLRVENMNHQPVATDRRIGPPHLGSRIAFVPKEGGKYRVVVTTALDKQIGEYVLHVERDGKGDSASLQRRLTEREKLYQGAVQRASSALKVAGLGNPSEAISSLEKALAGFKAVFPEQKYPSGDPDIAGCVENIALMYESLGNRERAVPLFK